MEKENQKKRTKITDSMIHLSFDLGRRLKNNQIEYKEGIQQLQAAGMNRNSASDYLYYYSKLLRGEQFTRTTSALATDYFLGRILLEEGVENLKLALHSLTEHISYYEKKAGVKIKSRKEILNKFKEKAGV